MQLTKQQKQEEWLWECNAALLDLSSSIIEGQPMAHLLKKAHISKQILQEIPAK